MRYLIHATIFLVFFTLGVLVRLHIEKKRMKAFMKEAAPDMDEQKNPDVYGRYERDFCFKENVRALLIDKTGLFYVVYHDPSIGKRRIFCEKMLEYCWEDCPKFKRALDTTVKTPVFSCEFIPCIYTAETMIKSKRSSK